MNHHYHKHCHQQGITLVGLLVSTALGILLSIIAVKAYLDSKTTFLFHEAVSAANENARFAIDDMRRILVMAGRDVTSGIDKFVNYGMTSGIKDGNGSASGRVAIRMEGGIDCLGNDMSTTTVNPPIVRFYIATANGSSQNELFCATGITSASGSPVSGQGIVEGIEYMDFLYGVDLDADGYANRYETATSVDSGSNWDNVVAIRVALVASSGNLRTATNGVLTTAPTFRVGNNTFTASQLNKIYRPVGTTIVLRNINAVVTQ